MSPYTNSHRPKTLPKREPVVTATVLIPALVFIAGWLGVDLDPETAAAIAGGLAAIGGLVARQFVTPVVEPVDQPRPRRPRRRP